MASAITLSVARYTASPHLGLAFALKVANGKIALTQSQLRDLVVGEGLSDAGTQASGVGFVNVDGNAVYYDSRDPKNVYLGLKGKDTHVEIFDPRPDQALAAAIMRQQVEQIK